MSEFVMVKRELAERLDNPHSYVRNLAREELRAVLAQEAGKCEPYGFASVLIDTFQSSIDNGKQPTFSKGDLLYFIEQLGKCQNTSPPAPVSVAITDEQIAKTLEPFGEINEWNDTISFTEARAVKGCKAVLDKVKELNQ